MINRLATRLSHEKIAELCRPKPKFSETAAHSALDRLLQVRRNKSFPLVTDPMVDTMRHAISASSGGFTIEQLMSATQLDYSRALRACNLLAYALLVHAPGTVTLLRLPPAYPKKAGGRAPFRFELAAAS